MAQTKEGALKMKQTIRDRYGVTADGKSKLHVEIGAKGGKKGTTGGFWHKKYVLKDDSFAVEMGAKGGRKSRKTK